MAADAEAVTRLASSNKEKEAEITSLHLDHRLIAQNLEMRQARDIEMLKAELIATNASEANAEHHRLALAAKNEQVRHAELKETKLKAETQINTSTDDALKEQMPYAHHAA
eukprot:16443593-Heterocapsa_arctica.AAC.1